MILILPILLYYNLACEPLIDKRSIYPTVGEYFELEMTEIFSGECNSYQCDGCTNEINIYNATEILVENALNQNIISVTSNETHFAALSELYLIIYQKGNVSQEYQNLYELPKNISCFNVIYTQPDTILLDCYQQNQLILLQFYENNFTNVYNSSSYLPQQTQMEVYFNYSSSMFLLYAQYYQTYSILTLLSNQNNSNQLYQNLSVCQYQNFTEFHSTYQFIYLLQNNTLYQIYINQQYQLINLTKLTFFSVKLFSVYQSYQSEGSCDIIIAINYNQVYRYLACYSNIQYQYGSQINNLLNSESIKCLSNNNFIIIFDDQNLQIIRNYYYFNILQTINITQNSQLIYNIFSNILYLFQQNFIELQIRVPALVINSGNIFQNETEVIIYAYFYVNNCTNVKIIQKQKYSSTINIQILQEFDTNIYVRFQNKQVNIVPQVKNYEYYNENIDNYSGQLINLLVYQHNKTNQIGQFYLNKINFMFNISEEDYKFCSLNDYSYQHSRNLNLFFATNNQVLLKQCDNYMYYNNDVCQNHYIFNSSSPIEQFQIAYNEISYSLTYIVGIQINSYFINCIYYSFIEQIYQNQVNASDQFISYLLTYNGIYVLLSNQSINFYNNCNQSQVITIDQQSINKAFNQSSNYSFNPKNITTNIQFISSLLYINNQTNVIIITLINNQLIPIQRIKSKNNYIIYGINLISNRLVLSFYNNQTLNFEVWNLFNIYSDNLFLYVQFNSTLLYIYNPALSQHSALYIQQTLTSSLMCSTAVLYTQQQNNININQINHFQQEYLQSILLINSNLYAINPINQLHFIINQSFQNDGLYPLTNYNISISSYLSQQILNESNKYLIYSYHFLNIVPESLNMTYDQTNNIATIIPFSSQLSNCYDKNNLCSNYKDSNQTCYSNQSYLINFIDNQIFYLAQNSLIYQFNGISKTQRCSYSQIKIINGSHNSITNCQASLVYNYFMYAICSNATSSYLIQFNFTNITNPIQRNISDLQNKFQQVYDMQIVQNGLFYAAGYRCLNSQLYQLYVFDLFTNSTKNLTDFPMYSHGNKFFIAISTKFFNKQYYIVTQINISSVHCLLMDSQFNLLDQHPISFDFQIKFLEINKKLYQQLILIYQQDNYMVALLTNNLTQYPLLKFHFHIETYINHITLSAKVEYLKFLPVFQIPYYNPNKGMNVTFSNGYLIINYFNQYLSIYTLSDYQNLQNDILSPILMQRQINISSYGYSYDLLSYQVSFNKKSHLINYVVFYQTYNDKIVQQILSINPKIQLECQSEPKSISCCIIGGFCTGINIEKPKIILNLIFPAILIIILVNVLYRIIYQKYFLIDDQEQHIEL